MDSNDNFTISGCVSSSHVEFLKMYSLKRACSKS
jgi:hypothetical protein